MESRVDAVLVRELAPDVVVVAAGGTPRRDGFQLHDPDKVVPGTELEHVFTVVDVFRDRVVDRGRVLVRRRWEV